MFAFTIGANYIEKGIAFKMQFGYCNVSFIDFAGLQEWEMKGEKGFIWTLDSRIASGICMAP